MKESKNLKDLKERVNYQKKYIDNYEEFAKKILNKTNESILYIHPLQISHSHTTYKFERIINLEVNLAEV